MKVLGVGRMADNERALLVTLDGVPTDDELRAFHEFVSTRGGHHVPGEGTWFVSKDGGGMLLPDNPPPDAAFEPPTVDVGGITKPGPNAPGRVILTIIGAIFVLAMLVAFWN